MESVNLATLPDHVMQLHHITPCLHKAGHHREKGHEDNESYGEGRGGEGRGGEGRGGEGRGGEGRGGEGRGGEGRGGEGRKIYKCPLFQFNIYNVLCSK